MPLIYYACNCGKSVSKFFRTAKESPSAIACMCGLEYKKQLSVPSSASKIVIDNGFMAKSVEVDLSIIDSNEKNSTKDFTKKD